MKGKKLISFSNYNMMESLIKGEVEYNGLFREDSTFVEKRLLDSYLPRSKQGRYYVVNCLYSEDGSIAETLRAIFSMNSAGLNWKSKYSNLFPLVKFSLEQLAKMDECKKSFSGHENEFVHFTSQLKSIVEILKNFECEDEEEKNNCREEIKRVEELVKYLSVTPSTVSYMEIYSVLVSNWTIINEWSVTYRLLADLSTMIPWNDSRAWKFELLEKIKEVTNEWDD